MSELEKQHEHSNKTVVTAEGMRKLEEGVADATFHAMAGLTRLGMADVARPIAVEDIPPAVA